MDITRPDNPGTYLYWAGRRAVRVPPSQAGTVALPGEFDWGPMLGEPLAGPADQDLVELKGVYPDLETLERVYGDGDTAGRRAAILGFSGARTPTELGAGGVIPVRMGAGAAAATATLDSTSAADAATFTALYKGTRGNRISLRVEADPATIGSDRLHVQLDGVSAERYSYAANDLNTLRAAMLARPSRLVNAPTIQVAGTALAKTTVPLAAGSNGTLSAATYLSALAALEYKPFSLLSFPNLTDAGILLSVASWITEQAAEMRPAVAVVGGAAGETLAQALSRTAALNAEGLDASHIVNVGVGTYRDSLLARDLSTAELAPRMAGMLAARGRGMALTGAEIAGLTGVGDTGPATDELRTAWQGGVTCLRRTSSADADLAVNKGVTAHTRTDVPDRPLDIFSEPRFIRIQDLFLRQLKQTGDQKFVGQRRVTDDTRVAWRQVVGGMQDELVEAELIENTPAPWMRIEPSGGQAGSDTIPFSFGWSYSPTLNNLVGRADLQLPQAG